MIACKYFRLNRLIWCMVWFAALFGSTSPAIGQKIYEAENATLRGPVVLEHVIVNFVLQTHNFMHYEAFVCVARVLSLSTTSKSITLPCKSRH
jgi:hypothetical protein